MAETNLDAFKAKDTQFFADWLKSKDLKLCSVFEAIQEPFILSLASKSVACVADETKPRYSPSANQRPKACSAPRVLPVLSIIGSNWLLHMAVLSCTVIGRVDVVEPWLRSR